MGNGNKPTVKEHYVPRVYLRGFSVDYIRIYDDSNKKHHVYFYDLNKKQQLNIPVITEDLCYKKHLYEIKKKDGKFLAENYLEHFLGIFEDQFGKYRTLLERKAFLSENFRINSFLGLEEKNFWKTYMIMQILRSPKAIQDGSKLAKEMFGDTLSELQARNAAIYGCLPFFRELKPDDSEMQIINYFWDSLSTLTFRIGVDETKSIITSDMPVFIYSPTKTGNDIKKIIFPITSEICLLMYPKNTVPNNSLMIISDQLRKEIFCNMVACADKMLFSKHLFSKKELKWIDEGVGLREKG